MAISATTEALASIELVGSHRNRSVLRRAKVAGGFVLVYGPDDQLVQHTIAPRIELDGLADVAVFLLDGFVVGGNIQSKFATLWICLAQLQAHARDRLGPRALDERELVIITIAFVLKDFKIITCSGDQSALHSQVANGAGELRLGRLEIGFC